jgi:hypothetical protein
VIIEKGDLKDELQEVPKGDNWPKRYFSFPGNVCLPLRDISNLGQYKKTIKPNSQSDPWDHWFLGFTVCPHAAFLFSSLQIKSF